MKKTLILIMGLFACVSIRSQTHPAADKGCMILDQPGKPLARKIPATVPGRMYRMSFKADLGGCDSLLAGAHLPQSSTQWFYRSGEHRFIFTANDTLSLVFFYINTPCRVSISYVKVEEVRIESRIVCKEDSAGYRYGFNGKEKIDEQYGIEGTSYDYGFRIYDSRIARFLSVDPLTASYPWYTPYQFAGNTPVAAIDIDGLEEYIVNQHFDQQGRITKISIARYEDNSGNPMDSELIDSKTGERITSQKIMITNHNADGTSTVLFANAFTAAQQSVLSAQYNIVNNDISPQSRFNSNLYLGKVFKKGKFKVNEQVFKYAPVFRGVELEKGKTYSFTTRVRTGLWNPNISDPEEAKSQLTDLADLLSENKDVSVILLGNFHNTSDPDLTNNADWQKTSYPDELRAEKGIPSDILTFGDYMTKRAGNVKKFLIKEFGVDPRQIKVGRGSAYEDAARGQSVTIKVKRSE